MQERALRKLGIYQFADYKSQRVTALHPQVLHSHFGFYAWENMSVAQRNKLAHCVTFYGLDVNALPQSQPVWRFRYKELFNQANCILCEGPYMAESIRLLGCPKDKVRVHHIGVKLSDIPFRPRTWDSNGPLKILIAATFREKKGIPFALEALGQLQKEVPLEITIIGDATADSRSRMEKKKILETIRKYRMKPIVRMLGFQTHSVLLEEGYKCHIFLSPSITASNGDTEGGAPVSIIEMAASGMPIISTKHCDIPSVIKHGKTGWLAEERDIEGLVEYLKWYVDHEDDWRKMLETGRAHIETEFNVQLQGIRLGQIYRDLLACKNDNL